MILVGESRAPCLPLLPACKILPFSGLSLVGKRATTGWTLFPDATSRPSIISRVDPSRLFNLDRFISATLEALPRRKSPPNETSP